MPRMSLINRKFFGRRKSSCYLFLLLLYKDVTIMGDTYNEYDARRYFNEFIDIVCRHKNRPELVGRFDELINANAAINGNFIYPLEDLNFELNQPFVDFHSLKTLYVLCYFRGNPGIQYNISFSDHNFKAMYTNFIKTEYSNNGRVINYEIFVDFVDNFQSLFNALFGKKPEYDLPTVFTDFNEDYQVGENPNPTAHNLKKADEDEDTYGGNVSKNRRIKNISKRCNKNKRRKSKTVKRFKKNVAGVKNKRKNKK